MSCYLSASAKGSLLFQHIDALKCPHDFFAEHNSHADAKCENGISDDNVLIQNHHGERCGYYADTDQHNTAYFVDNFPVQLSF